MKKENFKILAIESSCDETAAAVIGVADCHSEIISEVRRSRNKFDMADRHPAILSNIVSSQIDLHAKTGGVVPEVASRAHMEVIAPVISEALIVASQKISNQNPNDKLKNEQINENWEAKIDQYSEAIKVLQDEIDYIAVTVGPGLIGSLLVGYNAAKTIAYALNKPIIPINHIEGHIYSAFTQCHSRLNRESSLDPRVSLSNHIAEPEDDTLCHFPVLALTVSGGHTSLTLMTDHGKYQNIGATLDDAAGEAFDKVAKLLDLGYPGGPIVSKYAAAFKESKLAPNIKFPRPVLNDGTFNFSFSGLKTAVLQCVLNIKKERELTETDKEEVCAAFEDAVVDVLMTKAIRAIKKFKPKTVILAGGVAANDHLRDILKLKIENCKSSSTLRDEPSGSDSNEKINFLVPPKNLCGDNAAMIGTAAFYHILKNNITTWDKTEVDSNLEL